MSQIIVGPASLSGTGLVRQTVYNVHDYGAVGDGAGHALSTLYASDGAAQAAYPATTAFLAAASLPAISRTDQRDWAAIQEAICTARQTSGTFYAQAPVWLGVGQFLINRSLIMQDQYGLSLLGASPETSRILWAGAAAGVLLVVLGVRRGRWAQFSLVGDSATTTTALTYDGIVGGIPNTENVWEQVLFYRHAYGVRIGGVTHGQADQTMWRRCVFTQCMTLGASIEDANAVLHHFYDCLWQFGGKGISATNFLLVNNPDGSLGTGGSFDLYGCGFLKQLDWNVQLYPSNRGTVLNYWSERCSGQEVQASSGSTGVTATLQECSINGICYQENLIFIGTVTGGTYTLTYKAQTTTALPWDATAATVQTALEALATIGVGNIRVSGGPGPSTLFLTRSGALEQDPTAITTTSSLTGTGGPGITTTYTPYAFSHLCSGGLTFIGGKFQSKLGGKPVRMRTGMVPSGSEARRNSITCIGSMFDGDPFTGGANMQNTTVYLQNVQMQMVMDVNNPAQVSGPLSYGTPAAPRLLSEDFSWQAAVWVKIASGTVLAAGITTIAGSSLHCRGNTAILVGPVLVPAGLTTPLMVSARDTGDTAAAAHTTFAVDVVAPTGGVTLPADLVFRLSFQPEFNHY
jgi:hypothetical protein